MKRILQTTALALTAAAVPLIIGGCASHSVHQAPPPAPVAAAPGPFRITLDSCAPVTWNPGTDAQTTELTGIVTVTNTSNSVTDSVQVNMNFLGTDGRMVVGQGYSDESAPLAPGQSQQLRIGATGLTGAHACQPSTYLVGTGSGPNQSFEWATG